MAKIRLNELTKEELQDKEKQLLEEIEQLSNVIKASNTPVFDLLIKKVKDEMQDNIAEEEWKKLKENQKKIESYRSIEKTLQNQEDLLEEKEEELEDVQNAIENYQPSFFEQPEQKQEIEIEGEAEETNFEYRGAPIKTGDVFIKTSEGEDDIYYLIKKSTEISNSYAIISNIFEGERCLQYPSNFKILENSSLVGNIYVEDDNTQKALEGLKIIADSQEQAEELAEENESSNSAESESEPESDS